MRGAIMYPTREFAATSSGRFEPHVLQPNATQKILQQSGLYRTLVGFPAAAGGALPQVRITRAFVRSKLTGQPPESDRKL